MLGDSIDINDFIWNPVILKKGLLKPLKITIFRLGQKWGLHGPHPKQKKKCFL